MSDPRDRRIGRRTLLKWSLYSVAGATLLEPRYLIAAPGPAPVTPGPARSVIQIWMWGGPSHLDTFDPKPEAGNDYCGPLSKPIETNVSGMRICELLPGLSKLGDRFSIIRSMSHGNNAHETASYLVQTGHESEAGDGLVYPSIGALISLFRGPDHGYRGLVPPYIVLTTPQGRFSEAGFLGDQCAPFATGGDPNQKTFAVEGIVVQGVSEARQVARRELLRSVDTLGRAAPAIPEFTAFDRCGEKAAGTMAAAWKVFDLSGEKDEVRDRYGRSKFGQSCLVARRLVEAGVPWITINYEGWDTHKQNFQVMRQKLPEMDRGMSALIGDLSERGLLDSTIVWWSGEFGRTPRVQWEAPWNGGRGHHGRCFSAVVAGGGFRGGQVVGATDRRGEDVAEKPVHPRDLLRGIYQKLGIDPDAELPNSRGLSIPILAADGGGESNLAAIL